MFRKDVIEDRGVFYIRIVSKIAFGRLSALLAVRCRGINAQALAMRATLSRSGVLLGASHESEDLESNSVAFCETSDTGVLEKNIAVIKDWPSRHTKIGTKEKVLSEIAYTPDGTQ
ncbi:hypothetical protein CC86DRAFT_411732 [Ophiobolus disseminans]|uniref:Uncharacterized protein n=1 Tax=Ophiobolus disseminans TaxID=1469910 RepID=A0A6A6ZIP5_9PLEO|nr:hypothetical protein CC86DRAFT_411732 [Ophiobolus disseminans]